MGILYTASQVVRTSIVVTSTRMSGRHAMYLSSTAHIIITGCPTAVRGWNEEETTNQVLSRGEGGGRRSLPWRQHAVTLQQSVKGIYRQELYIASGRGAITWCLAPTPGPVWQDYHTTSPTSSPHSVETWCTSWTTTAITCCPPPLPSYPPKPHSDPFTSSPPDPQTNLPPTQHGVPSTQLRLTASTVSTIRSQVVMVGGWC